MYIFIYRYIFILIQISPFNPPFILFLIIFLLTKAFAFNPFFNEAYLHIIFSQISTLIS